MGVYTFLKAVLPPGSITFLALGVVAGLALLQLLPRRRWIGQTWLLVLASTYLLLSSPLVARALGDRLLPPESAAAPHDGVDILIVLDGDNRRARAAEAVHLWRHARPGTVVVVGGGWITNDLRAHGVPDTRLELHSDPSTTREQMLWLTHFAKAHPGQRLTLVVSRLQAARVHGMLRALDLDVDVRPTPVDHEPARAGWRVLWPSYEALRVSRDAIYELAACAYYRQRGWMA